MISEVGRIVDFEAVLPFVFATGAKEKIMYMAGAAAEMPDFAVIRYTQTYVGEIPCPSTVWPKEST